VEGHESPALNLTSKPPGLALTLRVRVWQGVSEYQSYSLWQMVEIADFVQQNSEVAASWKYGVSQSGPRGKMYTATNTHSCNLLQSCMTDH